MTTLTYETESEYADFSRITIEFNDGDTGRAVEICRRLLIAAGHHPDNVNDCMTEDVGT